MEFEWDETKSDACFADRGFDFAYVAHAFLGDSHHLGPQSQSQGGSGI